MKVIIKDAGRKKPLTIRIPLRMAMNSVTAAIVSCHSELTFEQSVAFMRAVRKASKQLKGIPMVEVREGNGNEVTVFL